MLPPSDKVLLPQEPVSAVRIRVTCAAAAAAREGSEDAAAAAVAAAAAAVYVAAPTAAAGTRAEEIRGMIFHGSEAALQGLFHNAEVLVGLHLKNSTSCFFTSALIR